MSRLLIGVSGGVAAYKALGRAPLAAEAGADVRGVGGPGWGVGGAPSSGEGGAGGGVEPGKLGGGAEALTLGGGGGMSSADRGSGVRGVVTAGGTREPIDSVRYIGNRSSGR